MSPAQCKQTDEKLGSLRGRLKIPLFLMATGAGLLGSLSMTFLKGMTESFEENGVFGSFSLYGYLILSLCLSVFQLNLLNMTMEIYDQIEIIPIYNSSMILLNICAGAIVLNEKLYYTWGELCLIILCGCISIVGVWVIIYKPVSISEEVRPEPLQEHLPPKAGLDQTLD
eukprot:CAMPEP_0168619692 /NCGR_PEP_ID=MMETSP0449_2-20121227/6739_1 /TAXON_ID=1082188 /ORGANISM="Strombidium rassoulzadegani, Strain ras09" /LENGTH=169 /DNA_ID=CAMNT_0008660647 /DNA_START=234 /DNA_END=743 /DNA_ORIENTATION=+